MTDPATGSAPIVPLARPIRVDAPVRRLASPLAPATAPVAAPAAPPAKTPTQLSCEQILDATAACLKEMGYDGTTIRRIAKRLGCAVGSIYRYFEDKRALLAAVTRRRFEPVFDRIESGVSVGALADAYLLIATEQPELYRLMFWLSSVGRPAGAGDAMPEVATAVIEHWTEQLGDRDAAELLWSRVHGAAILGRDGLHGELESPAASKDQRSASAGPAASDDLTLL